LSQAGESISRRIGRAVAQYLVAVAVGGLAGGGVSFTFATPASAAVDCSHHYEVGGEDPHLNSSGNHIRRAGTGMGGHGTNGDGLFLGSSGIQNGTLVLKCARVASAYSFHDDYNQEELGAAQVNANNFTSDCPNPSGGNWYRFWRIQIGNSHSCSASDPQQQANSWHLLEIYRDATHTSDWHITWGGSSLGTLTAPTVTSGYPLGATERWNTNDSMFGRFDEPLYQVAGGGWAEWGIPVDTRENNDSSYSVVSYTGNGLYLTQGFYVEIP